MVTETAQEMKYDGRGMKQIPGILRQIIHHYSSLIIKASRLNQATGKGGSHSHVSKECRLKLVFIHELWRACNAYIDVAIGEVMVAGDAPLSAA